MVEVERYEILEHTADIGIQVYAPSIEKLFIVAAKAMFKLICPKGKINDRERHSVHVSGGDRQELLVNWLSELNYLFQTREFLVSSIHDFQMMDNSLNAIITGERIDPQRHHLHIDIKAVTYHNLCLQQVKQNQWMARVYFDI